jgi:hypothetical protein
MFIMHFIRSFFTQVHVVSGKLVRMYGLKAHEPLIRLRVVCGAMGSGDGFYVVVGWCMSGVMWWLSGVMWWVSGVMWWVSSVLWWMSGVWVVVGGVWVKPPSWADLHLSNFGSGVYLFVLFIAA